MEEREQREDEAGKTHPRFYFSLLDTKRPRPDSADTLKHKKLKTHRFSLAFMKRLII